MISSNKAEALFQKRDYQKIFLEDAKKAQKRGNESAAFHLYERAMFYYPKNENIIKSYAEFCESRQYYDKAKDLYIKLFIMTKANKYLFKRYLCEIKDNKYPNSKLQKYSDNKLLNEGQKRLLNVEMIKQFAYEQDWENTKKACDKILKKACTKNN
jgi:hydroxymethylpyrimidine pyrophosphatase-like HAD family hydrolase